MLQVGDICDFLDFVSFLSDCNFLAYQHSYVACLFILQVDISDRKITCTHEVEICHHTYVHKMLIIPKWLMWSYCAFASRFINISVKGCFLWRPLIFSLSSKYLFVKWNKTSTMLLTQIIRKDYLSLRKPAQRACILNYNQGSIDPFDKCKHQTNTAWLYIPF